MAGKKCNVCGEMKDFSNYYKSKDGKDGYEGKCKTCRKNGQAPGDGKNKAETPPEIKQTVSDTASVNYTKSYTITLDFSEYTYLYEGLIKDAMMSFRTPENQILSVLAKHIAATTYDFDLDG